MTAYYVVEEADDFFADDFGNDDAPNPLLALQYEWDWDEIPDTVRWVNSYQQFNSPAPLTSQLDIAWDEEPDEFFADDFGNDDHIIVVPRAPLTLTIHLGKS